jgi:chloramphenicol-sensitive protein RarD
MNQNKAEFGQDLTFSFALFSAGVFTVVPLLMFNAATTRLPLTITGLLQYITPTIMFLVGIIVFHEELQLSKLIGFIIYLGSTSLFRNDMIKSGRSTNQSGN